MYRCKHYEIRGLVPQEIYRQIDDKDQLWLLFCRTGLRVIDCLREDYGVMTINDWPWGGKRELAGFRPWNTQFGALLSQHKFGRGFDLRPEEADVYQIRQDIIDQKEWYMLFITGLELDVSWLHIDFRNSIRLVTFNPQ